MLAVVLTTFAPMCIFSHEHICMIRALTWNLWSTVILHHDTVVKCAIRLNRCLRWPGCEQEYMNVSQIEWIF